MERAISSADRRLSARSWLEGGALLASSLASTALVFSQEAFALLCLLLPVTALISLRQGALGLTLHNVCFAAVSLALTNAGHGPIAALDDPPMAQWQIALALLVLNYCVGVILSRPNVQNAGQGAAAPAHHQELALLANHMSDAILKIDTNGVCTYASPAVRDVLAEEPSAFLGRSLVELPQEDASQRIGDMLSRLLKGETEKERLTYRRRLDDEEGRAVFIEADCTVVTNPQTNSKEGLILSARDVTERVELELLLTRARRHAENAANAKSDFLANMSHEIRTPMNGVLGFAELMLQGELDKDQRRYADMIAQSGRSMMLLLNDILDLSKIEAGQIVIDTSPINLHATLEDCIALHRQTATKKNLSLSLEWDSKAPGQDAPLSDMESASFPLVMTDGLRLRQIVLNLIGNAVKFTENGDVVVSCWAHAGELGVKVRDTGIGIREDRLETVFEPFTQAHNDLGQRAGGAGLGLSISRQLAQILGGRIEVESAPGKGSTFTLTLPALLAEEPERAPDLAPFVAPEDLPPEAQILLVEDHEVNRMVMTEMLERCGQNVAIAQDGNEAISMVIDSYVRGRPFDLVLMDVQMPHCDGYEATRAIREEGIGPETLPIIALTANAFPEDVAAAHEAGMQAHLAKPIVFAPLAKALQRWLPTRIVEAPMDRDVPPSGAIAREAPATDGNVKGSNPATKLGAGLVALRQEDRDPQQLSQKIQPDESAIGLRANRRRELVQKWLLRRSETVEAVRHVLTQGQLGNAMNRRAQDKAEREELIGLLHKLSGSAATFGEAELGDKAAALERALMDAEPGEECEKLASELLAIADEPTDPPSHAKESTG